MDMNNGVKGLKKLRSGNCVTATTPTAGSKTQQRKANLSGYNVHQRKFGVNGSAK